MTDLSLHQQKCQMISKSGFTKLVNGIGRTMSQRTAIAIIGGDHLFHLDDAWKNLSVPVGRREFKCEEFLEAYEKQFSKSYERRRSTKITPFKV